MTSPLPSVSRLRASLRFPLASLILVLTACGSQPTPPALDGGSDAATPPALDAGLDATTDDASPDGDLSADGSPDDAADDAASDASSTPHDASDDAADDGASGSDASADGSRGDASIDAAIDAPAPTPLPIVLASSVTSAALALDDANVYFTTPGGGVGGIARTGGSTFVVAQDTGNSWGGALLRLDGSTLYWDPVGPGGANLLFSIATSARNASAVSLGNFGIVALDFAVNGATAYAASTCLRVNTLSTSGSSAAGTFYNPGCNRLPQWLSFQLDSTNATLDALDDYPYQIDRLPLDGGARTTVTVDSSAALMAIHGGSIYWVDVPACGASGCPASTLYMSALDGSNPKAVATGAWQVGFGQGSFGPITDAYAFLLVRGGIIRVTLATGESELAYAPLGSSATSIPAAGSVAVDGTSLYVSDPLAGLVSLSLSK